ncbi:MAG TPA: transporter substrate-binding domain-containing protein [Gaiellaceae bacterium]|nr:transporter substrate-binding domain-containing protein [Gaiellaceae bacterium]
MTRSTRLLVESLAPSGALRASINLGNPVLAQGTPAAPTGVTVEIARELGSRLEVPVELVCFDAARKSLEAMTTGEADVCFLAIEPEREAIVAFTAPYVVIEGVFAVRVGSTIAASSDVDREGTQVGVKRGAAYDLFLSRTLRRATLVRTDDTVDALPDPSVEVLAGIRQPMTAFVAGNPGFRLLEARFMEIRQALGTSIDRDPAAVQFLRSFIEELKETGFIADALRRAGQTDAEVAPPALLGFGDKEEA